MSPWVRQTKGAATSATEPRLSIHADANGRFNAPADERWLAEYDHVAIHRDIEGGRIAFEPLAEGDDHAFRLSRKRDHGADIQLRGTLSWFGVERDDLDETTRVTPERNADGWLVVDLAPLLAAAGADEPATDEQADEAGGVEETAAPDPAEKDDDQDTERPSCHHCGTVLGEQWRAAEAEAKAEGTHPADCIACGQNPLPPVGDSEDADDETEDTDADAEPAEDADAETLIRDYLTGLVDGGQTYRKTSAQIGENLGLGSRSVAYHLARADWDGVTVSKADAPERPETVWRIEPATDDVNRQTQHAAVEAAVEDGVDSVQELAEYLDCSEGRARNLARGAGVYGDIHDKPPRPGVDR